MKGEKQGKASENNRGEEQTGRVEESKNTADLLECVLCKRDGLSAHGLGLDSFSEALGVSLQ